MKITALSNSGLRTLFGLQSSAPKLNPDRVLTPSATCLALFGIAVSSFSLGQMLDSNSNKSSNIPVRKFY